MPSDYETDAATAGDGMPTLPDDVRELYQTLQREGASWRRSAAPEIERVNQHLRAQVALLSAQRPEEETAMTATTRRIAQPLVTVHLPDNYADGAHQRMASSHRRSSSRVYRWLATGATLVVIAGFVGVLALYGWRRPSDVTQQGATGGVSGLSRAAQTALNSSGWTHLSALDYAASFSANDPPAIAPSDPNVVYETMAQGMQEHQPASMRATSNGGKTWRTLALPVPADHIGDAGIGVSPLDPQVIFLSLIDTSAADCPANRLETNSQNGETLCRLEYTSVDGGAHWRTTHLPLAGGALPGLLTASVNSGMAGPIQSATVRAQGQRLFAGFLCNDGSCSRLVTSSDGGLTWSFADQPMLASGAANVCDYINSPTGATLYAVTTASQCDFNLQVPLTLWTSSDAGASWSKVGQLATPNERGMLLAQDGATGASLLYMALPRTTTMATDKMGDKYPIFSQSPSDVQVSVDGGQTWQHAPTKGIPADHAVYLQLGLLGTLRDGAVVVDVIPPDTATPGDSSNFNGSDLYAWRPGDAGWQKLASVPQEIDALLVTPASSGSANTLYALLVDRSGVSQPFTIARRDVAR